MGRAPPPERCRAHRFELRCWAPGDGAALQTAHAESYEHLQRFLPWADARVSVADAEAWVRGRRARWLLGEDFSLGVWTPDGARVLGGTGFHLGGSLGGRAEIGLWIRADAAGQGLGGAVLREMLRWGFEAWGWRRLTWRCSARNVASRRTAEGAGMRLEGVLRADAEDPDGITRDTLIFGALAVERGR